MSHICIVGVRPRSLVNFRGQLIRDLIARGHTVTAVAGNHDADIEAAVAEMGADFRVVEIERTGMGPGRDLQTLWQLWRVFRDIKPDGVFTYTVKPVIYGSIAASLAGVRKRWALITGLGFVFQENEDGHGAVRKAIRYMYKLALRFNSVVLFQNSDDLALFRELGILRKKAVAHVVDGSGVDLNEFHASSPGVSPRFLMIGRLLIDKGVREYAEAAGQIRKRFPGASFCLAGWLDENPRSISKSELENWINAGTIEYLGQLDDVRPAIADANIYVLPSYREGTPRTVLEAMACGRPVITTSAPGCRETVRDGYNGLIVPPHDAVGLEKAMAYFIEHPDAISEMGANGLELARSRYDVRKVNARIIDFLSL